MSLLIFIFGLLIGSFLNVIIVRVPKGEGIFLPRSHCPKCNKLIRWYENIPLLSYIFIRGKCRGCQSSISIVYPLVELLGGLGAFFLINFTGGALPLFHSVILFSAFCVFLCHFVIDLRHQILPDGLNIYLGCIFLMNMIIFLDWQFSLIGFCIGFGFPYLITLVFYFVRGEVGLGGGDIKLYGVLGLYLGPLGVLQNIFLSSILGSLVTLSLICFKKADKKTPIPFGPFIIAVASWQIFSPKTYQNSMMILLP